MTSALIDASLASTIGRRLAPAGPSVSATDARAAVTMLRELAGEAEHLVAGITGMQAGAGHSAVVVDRGDWIDSNVESLEYLLSSWTPRKEPSKLSREVGSRTLAVQVGMSLSWLSTKVLGQYEVFSSNHSGRLLLVAPNIVDVEQLLNVDARDFRLWVCLHEETHRVQFGANPWLVEYLRELIVGFLEASDVPPQELAKQFASTLRRDAAKPPTFLTDTPHSNHSVSGSSWFERLQNAEQQFLYNQITAVMSLLEGHADVVMDEVGPQVVKTLPQIRAKFQDRRTNPSTLDRIVRSALGMDAKLRQYSDGAKFVRHVVDAVGMQGFNRVWESPETLPTRTELHAPDLWLARTGVQAVA